MKKNTFYKPFFLILLSTIALIGLSFVPNQISFFGFEIKKIDFLSEIKTKKETTLIVKKENAQDSTDTDIEKSVSIEPILLDFVGDTATGLTRFFEHLMRLKKEVPKIRIAYFGDSMIEGDLLTMDLRSIFQKKYGGEGVGMVAITSNTAPFRMTIKQTFSENFTNYSLLDTNANSKRVGITGFSSVPALNADTLNTDDNSWVSFSASNFSRLDKFKKVKLFFGPSKAKNIVNLKFGAETKRFLLDGLKPVNELSIDTKSAKSIQSNFSFKEAVSLYGMSFESDSGVFVDNYAVRGNSGLTLTKIPQSVLSGFNTYLNYDLIILHYGLNATNPAVKNYGWYEKGLENMVNHMKRSFPKSSFLLVSVNDKSYKENGEFVTDPSVLLIVEAQKRVAQKTKIAFFNLYEAMGGYNSMVKWATADTALANKDYTHLNRRGAAKVASMLYKELNTGFENYKKKPQL
ncbi:MAG: hypothetical protein V4667_14010 [Bacteroidota bacterium]